ncbi:ATP-binding cassette domain-containing protein [Actinophytocola oryzae]|uniref:ABC-type multidrug transport system ATPase subunit n=1 Tax=Actinophytocola oryzae TaxID=502181 RepID=A0A4R7VRH7_9PSEU|nr:ATP-binding cassette domain-containing protein [Actinophytocola oryzae]TDV52065.1 ABC-type multidrug transport system ATPase subunit [Actinophytocola oryzae]
MPVTKTLARVQALAASWTAGDFTLEPVTAEIGTGRLVAIIGPSGAGKTTLLELLAGVRTPSKGQVTNPPEVGFVPQDDIVHTHLPLRRTLSYAARLRGEHEPATVAEILETLGLTQRAAATVGTLSGGERKRASIAVELLARPDILFLDEPTSGLDPATGRDLLRHLRSLVDGGNTVVLTTHTPGDIALCDEVFVLDGGRLVYAGTPSRMLEHFGVATAEEVYDRLGGDPPEWSPAAVVFEPPQPVPQRHRVSALRQWWLLTARSVELLARNRVTLAILMGSPVVIALMFLMLFRPGAFEQTNPVPNTTVMILFWIAFGGFFFGLTYGLSQICDEFAILRRESRAGLRVAPYLLSKVAALLPLLCLVDALLLALLSVTDRLPALDLAGDARLFGTVVLASLCALTLGLLCSSSVNNPSQAALTLPMLCFPQVLFVGAFLPVPVMADVGRYLSYAMSNRWAFEALGHTAGLPELWRDGGSQLGPPLLASYGDTFDHPLWVDWSLLAGFAVLFAAGAVLVLRRKAGPAR